MNQFVGVSTTLQPDFIDTPSGRLFTLLYQPAVARTSDIIVLLPPFGEEMNKSRRQISLSARTWSDLGYPVLVFDLFGTGDSEGAFVEASVVLWQENIKDVLDWLVERGFTTVTLWALRFGALFIPGLLQVSTLPVSRAILWQPVISGKQSISQFLRLQSAANLLGQKRGRTVAELQEILAAGDSVEVAGYGISSKLYNESLDLSLSPVATTPAVLDWFQIGGSVQSTLPPAASRVIDRWQTAGIQVHAQVLPGEPFWSTTELVTVPELITRTTALWPATPNSTVTSQNGA